MALNISKKLLVPYLLFITLCLGACSNLTQSDEPAMRTWWLTPYTGTPQVALADLISSVSITVIAVPGLDTDQILTLSQDSQLQPYSAARWVENLPELTKSLVGRTLEASERFEVDSNRAPAGLEKCELQMELQKFFALLDSSGQTSSVQVAINARYQCKSGEPANLQLSSSIPVHDGGMKVIVAAFQQAMDNTMKDMLAQLP